MRPPVLALTFLFAGSPPAVMASEPAGSLWVGSSGLQARLSRDGTDYVLRAEPAGFFGDFFSGISSGTVLLRARRSGDTLTGTAYVFSPGCVFSYPVRGSWLDNDTRIVWSGQEPKTTDRNGCRATASAFATTSLLLKWAPPQPPPAPPRPAPQPGAQPLPSSGSSSAVTDIATVLAICITALIATSLGGLLLRLAYLHRLRANQLPTRPLPAAPREPASPFSSSLPSSSGKILGNRTQIVQADAQFVKTHTAWLLQRTAQTNAAGDLVDARLRLVEKLAHLATVPALMNHADPNASPTSFSLSLGEIEQMIAAMPEISPELRSALLRLLAARLKEKLQ